MVFVNETEVSLTRKEFDLLLYFVSNKNKVISKNALAEHISGDIADMFDNYDFVYAHIKNLKKKLAEARLWQLSENALWKRLQMGYMSKLLNRSLRIFIICAALVLAASIPVFYLAIDMLWKYEQQEHNIILTPEAGQRRQMADRWRGNIADSFVLYLIAYWFGFIEPVEYRAACGNLFTTV